MDDTISAAIVVALASFLLWLAVSAAAAVSMLLLVKRSDNAGLPRTLELWLATAGTGAAGGGFLGLSVAVWATSASWPPRRMFPYLGWMATGMLLGAVAGVVTTWLALSITAEWR